MGPSQNPGQQNRAKEIWTQIATLPQTPGRHLGQSQTFNMSMRVPPAKTPIGCLNWRVLEINATLSHFNNINPRLKNNFQTN